MNTPASSFHDDSPQRLAQLSDVATRLLELARSGGATQAEVACSERRGLNVGVRMGEVETVESTRDRGISVTVYVGQRKGSASTGDVRDDSLQATVAQAIAIARHTEPDPAAGLADAERMARDVRDFDTWHPQPLDADAAIALALACEQAGRDSDARIANSDGASASSGDSVAVYANSHGFLGRERETHSSLGCALIAGQGDSMQRDGWYSVALAAADLEDAASIGRKAAQRTLERLDPQLPPTGKWPVLFASEMARSLIGSYVAAVSGGALYRKASFLLESVGQPVFPEWFGILEDPFIARGFRSSSYDAEGVATTRSALVEGGVVQRYVLGSYSARKLGLQSTGNAGGVHNLRVTSNAGDLASQLQALDRGIFVTELMGQGVNGVTGDYSRGAAGFWVENGRIQHAIDGFTIAGNLKTMFRALRSVGNEADPRSHIHCGAMLIDGMTIAGSASV